VKRVLKNLSGATGVLAAVATILMGISISTTSASATDRDRCAAGRFGRICTNDVVRYLYNEAVGTVVRVNPRAGVADVSWNIVGSGFGHNLSVDVLIPGRGQENRRCARVSNGRACVGDIVGYLYNEAIGTVVDANGYANEVSVSWNIVGSGFGYRLPGHTVYRRY
jgi:hypothetical protein